MEIEEAAERDREREHCWLVLIIFNVVYQVIINVYSATVLVSSSCFKVLSICLYSQLSPVNLQAVSKISLSSGTVHTLIIDISPLRAARRLSSTPHALLMFVFYTNAKYTQRSQSKSFLIAATSVAFSEARAVDLCLGQHFFWLENKIRLAFRLVQFILEIYQLNPYLATHGPATSLQYIPNQRGAILQSLCSQVQQISWITLAHCAYVAWYTCSIS